MPTTAPSVVAISICACGRTCATSLRSASIRSGAAACAIPTLRCGESVDVDSNSVLELGERLLVAAHALQRHDLAVADRQDRLHVQQVAGERGGAADAAALREVLERVHGEEQLVRASGSARRTRRSPRRSCRARAAAARRSRASRATPRRCASRSRAPCRRRAARPRLCALANVPESVDEICSERMRSYAARAPRTTARKSPGVGCDVVGSSVAVVQPLVEALRRRSRRSP